jgi:hypothetical protein
VSVMGKSNLPAIAYFLHRSISCDGGLVVPAPWNATPVQALSQSLLIPISNYPR